MKANLNFGFNFTIYKISIGLPDAEILICLMLTGKWDINRSKTKEIILFLLNLYPY